ncbi:TIGR02301 family protein [Phreatobacter aquaticus]|uniref:TIGR02301 family protein n=1 Tax=Phreatobacter aquaticus TaxID=2570229 RepID=A0A4D7QKN8_9HYPH|nr:TIGR02301 family protein [Phreatobacter aquaticus]QCK86269.1 TIGR02301 family protein [Phreatobacter aquaticus]
MLRLASALTLAALLGLTLATAPALAQSRAAAPTPPPPVVPDALLQAPYEPQLIRLSEIMGALHYLRTLCPSPETGAWRREMQALIDAEATTAERRDRLTQSFNRGYGGFEATYRTCTAAARVATRRYADEGLRIVSDITSRFVN